MTLGGLTDAEVAQRVADGRVNDIPIRATRSIAHILRAKILGVQPQVWR